jgi:hypothetical protein
MKFMLNLIRPLLKYKWAFIGGMWLYSLLYLNSFKSDQCEASRLKDIAVATQEQTKAADKADLIINKEQISHKKESENGVKHVIEYKEKIKNVKSDCPIDPIISDEFIRLYDNTSPTKTENPS